MITALKKKKIIASNHNTPTTMSTNFSKLIKRIKIGLRKRRKYVTVTYADIEIVPYRLMGEMIYVESSFNAEMNMMLEKHLDMINGMVGKTGKRLQFLPAMKDELKEILTYFYPGVDEQQLKILSEGDGIQQIYNAVLKLSGCELSGKQLNGFVTYDNPGRNNNIYVFTPVNDLKELKAFLNLLVAETRKSRSKSGIKLCIGDDVDDQDDIKEADEHFYFESRQLIDEISERIEYLLKMGLTQQGLIQLLSLDNKVKLSRMVITAKYKIFLPDFNRLEITMASLPKAVFLLFLKHPEGIIFKHLPDYKDELAAIYKSISNRDDDYKIMQSIEDITNPFNNSINEKCSRIREAFVRHFTDDIAKHYYITGNRSMPKRITIDRSLVEWE